MFTYFDKNYTYADDTILIYTGAEENVTIPSRVKWQPIRRVGNQSFFMNRIVKNIVIEDGVEEIGTNAFYGCQFIRSFTAPGSLRKVGSGNYIANALEEAVLSVRLSRDEAEILLHSSASSRDGTLLLRPSILPKNMKENLTALGIRLSALPETQSVLLREELPIDAPDTVGHRTAVCGTGLPESVKTEQDAVLYELTNRRNRLFSNETEAKADWNQRTRNERSVWSTVKKETLAFIFKKELMTEGWDTILPVHFRMGYYSSIRLTPVLHMGKTYFIYTRCYMYNGDVYPIDIAVLDENGTPVKDDAEADHVYAKYYLPMIL